MAPFPFNLFPLPLPRNTRVPAVCLCSLNITYSASLASFATDFLCSFLPTYICQNLICYSGLFEKPFIYKMYQVQVTECEINTSSNQKVFFSPSHEKLRGKRFQSLPLTIRYYQGPDCFSFSVSSSVLVYYQGSCNKRPQTGGLKNKCIASQLFSFSILFISWQNNILLVFLYSPFNFLY